MAIFLSYLLPVFISTILEHMYCNHFFTCVYLYFSYVIERGVCFLVLCEHSFSKRLAFSFLEDLQTEFTSNYGQKVDSVSRPYSFIEFGKLHPPVPTTEPKLRKAIDHRPQYWGILSDLSFC